MKIHYIIEYYSVSFKDWARLDTIEYETSEAATRRLMQVGLTSGSYPASYRVVKVYTAREVEMTYSRG